MKKVPEYIKFRSETMRMLAFALSIPFGHFMLGLILEEFKIEELFSKFQFLFSVILLFITDRLIVYSIKSIKDKENINDSI